MKNVGGLFVALFSIFATILLSVLIFAVPVGVGWVFAQVLPFSWFQTAALVVFLCIGVAVVAKLDSIRKALLKIRDAIDDEDYDVEDYDVEDYDVEDDNDEYVVRFVEESRKAAESDAAGIRKRIALRKRQRQARRRQRG